MRACVVLSGRIRVAVQFIDDKMATFVACLRATETATCCALMAVSRGLCKDGTQDWAQWRLVQTWNSRLDTATAHVYMEQKSWHRGRSCRHGSRDWTHQGLRADISVAEDYS